MSCKVQGCFTRRGSGKSTFRIPDPSRKPDLCNKWLNSLRISPSGYVHNSNNFVCEDHFEQCCFEDSLMARLVGNAIKRKKWLKPNSVPTIFHDATATSSKKRELCQDYIVKRELEDGAIEIEVLTDITVRKKRHHAMEPEDGNVLPKKTQPRMVDIGVQVCPSMKSAASECSIQLDVTAATCTNCSIATQPYIALTDHRYCLRNWHFNR